MLDDDEHFLETEAENEEEYKTALQVRLHEVIENCLWGENDHKALVVYVNGSVAALKGDIIDTITTDLDSWISRHNRWASLEALEVINRGKDYGVRGKGNIIKPDRKGNPIEQKRWLRERYYALPIFLRPVLYFLYRYFFRLGFLDGKEGFIFHFFQGFWYRFLVDTKIFEMKKIKKLD